MSVTEAPWKPSLLRRSADRMLSRMLHRGKGPDFLHLLTVVGRTSGRPHTTPVAPVRDGDRLWVVSPFGDVDWVRNLRVAGQAELGRGDERTRYTARELDPSEAVPVLRAYLAMPSERFVRREFAVTNTSTNDAIAGEAPHHPVFALTR